MKSEGNLPRPLGKPVQLKFQIKFMLEDLYEIHYEEVAYSRAFVLVSPKRRKCYFFPK